MKRILFAGVILAAATLLAGTWTEDFEAAKKTSLKRNLPLMLDFTGSDWCYWCKLMDRQVFAEREWEAWAQTNLVCVTVDFPRDESKITPAQRKKNRALLEKYGVRGFPTFVLLAAGGERELGRAQCPGRDVTPAQFIAAVKRTIDKTAPAVK